MPASPSARYNASAAKPRSLPSMSPTSKTPKFCIVSGTGVNGSGSVTRAHSATKILATTTRAACCAQVRARSAGERAWVIGLVISSPQTEELYVRAARFRLAKRLFLRLGFYLDAPEYIATNQPPTPRPSPGRKTENTTSSPRLIWVHKRRPKPGAGGHFFAIH